MADKIYVVVASGGDYEDYYSNNLAATTDPEAAKEYVVTLLAEQAKHNALIERCNAHIVQFTEQLGPVPVEPCLFLPYEEFRGRMPFTQKMMNERLKINLLNDKICARNHLAQHERNQLIYNERVELMTSLGYSKDDVYFQINNDSYDIEELDVI